MHVDKLKTIGPEPLVTEAGKVFGEVEVATVTAVFLSVLSQIKNSVACDHDLKFAEEITLYRQHNYFNFSSIDYFGKHFF